MTPILFNIEYKIGAVLTTSRKLSTGVDARNVRNIVLMRPIHSMIEFKQIIGRGTWLFDGKDYFTIYDFVKAYELFNDAEWDGEPIEPSLPEAESQGQESYYEPVAQETVIQEEAYTTMVKVKLADGKARSIRHMITTSFYGTDGKPMSADQFVQHLYGALLPELFKDEAELRSLWSQPDARRKLIEGLAERGCGETELADLRWMVDAPYSDLYDMLAYIAFAQEPMSRAERAASSKDSLFTYYSDEKQQEFLNFVLEHYVSEGVGELDTNKLPTLLELKYESVPDAAQTLGMEITEVRHLFVGFQKYLYDASKVA